MKILHVCPLYYPSVGGNQIHIQMISEKLASLNQEVHVFTSYATDRSQFQASSLQPKQLLEKEILNGVHIQRFKINHFLLSLVCQRLPKMRGGYQFINTFFKDARPYWKLGPMVKGMVKAIGELKPDFILSVMENSFTTYLCYKAKKRFDIPLVFMPITHIVDQKSFHDSIKNIYVASDLLIACTKFEKNLLIHRGVDAQKIKVLPLGF